MRRNQIFTPAAIIIATTWFQMPGMDPFDSLVETLLDFFPLLLGWDFTNLLSCKPSDEILGRVLVREFHYKSGF
jgi:hypothetical protein